MGNHCETHGRRAYFCERGHRLLKVHELKSILLTTARTRRGILAFGFAKSTMLFAPLLLAQAIGLRDYGEFEYAVAIGSVLSMVLGFGMAGSIPYFLLQRRLIRYAVVFRFHTLVSCLIETLAAIAYAAGAISLTPYLTCTIACILVIQTLDATARKIDGRLVLSSFFDSGLYIVLFGTVVLVKAAGLHLSLPVIAALLTAYLFFLLSLHLPALFRSWSWRHGMRRYAKALRFGCPLIFSTALMVLLASAGRILAGRFIGMDAVGAYSFFFRLAGAVLVVHQLVTTVFFRQLYTANAQKLDRYYSFIYVVVLACSILGFFILPIVLAPFTTLLVTLTATGRPLYFVLCLHVALWIAMALLEMITTRETLAGQTVWLLAVAVCGLGIVAWQLSMRHTLTALRLAEIHLLVVAAVVLGQLWLLSGSSVNLPIFRRLIFATAAVVVIGLLWL